MPGLKSRRGGGVCRVATTVFRAAFWSAVDITERHQHAYRVSWYESKGEPVGFDAAVFDPGVDFKFVNNTPGFLLVQSVLTGDEEIRRCALVPVDWIGA